MHNFYICKGCQDKKVLAQMAVQYRIKSLSRNRNLVACLCSVYGMFCAVCQMHDSTQPQPTAQKVLNLSPNVRYRPDTIKGHFLREDINKKKCIL